MEVEFDVEVRMRGRLKKSKCEVNRKEEKKLRTQSKGVSGKEAREVKDTNI